MSNVNFHPLERFGSLLIDGKLSGLNDFCLQILEIRIVKPKLPLERPIRDPLMPLEKLHYLIKYRVEVHAQSASRIVSPLTVQP